MSVLACVGNDDVPLGRFRPSVFILATLASAAILVSLVAIPQWLSKQARWEVLRAHVGQIGQLAASAVNGDEHRQLLDPANYSDELYTRALKPLVRFHSANSDLFYVYTMVAREGSTYFVLDTAMSPDLRTNHSLRASSYMERFSLRGEYEDDWVKQIAAGKTYVSPTYEQDDYGYFLSAHVPISDSNGRQSGFVGVDFDVQYYLAQEARFRVIEIGSLVVALIVSVLIGYRFARYHFAQNRRMQEHYDRSIRDGLTGLLNRRGAMDALQQSSARNTGCYAMLLVDIDNLKSINDTHGHAVGDAVIFRTADVIRKSIREGDECARLGGDEFMIFAPACDADAAAEIGRHILERLSTGMRPPDCARLGVSIGIVVQSGAADFDQMYHDADAALYYAKAEGKSSIANYAPFMTAAGRGAA